MLVDAVLWSEVLLCAPRSFDVLLVAARICGVVPCAVRSRVAAAVVVVPAVLWLLKQLLRRVVRQVLVTLRRRVELPVAVTGVLELCYGG